MNPSPATGQKRLGRIDAVDWLRGLAVVLMIETHLYGYWTSPAADLFYLRVYSGCLPAGERVWNPRTQERERLRRVRPIAGLGGYADGEQTRAAHARGRGRHVLGAGRHNTQERQGDQCENRK